MQIEKKQLKEISANLIELKRKEAKDFGNLLPCDIGGEFLKFLDILIYLKIDIIHDYC